MSTITTASRLRRYTMGAALILFPALLIAQAAIDPGDGGTAEERYTAAAQHVPLHVASALLLLISGILMAPAVAGLLHQARDRGAALANVAAVFAVLGGFGHAAIAMFGLFSLSLAGGERTQMVALIDRLDANTALNAVAFPLIFCFALAVLTMAWSAWRAGLIGWWAPAVVTAVVLAHILLPDDAPGPIELIGMVALTAVFGRLGARILRMTDSQWVGVRPTETRTPAHV